MKYIKLLLSALMPLVFQACVANQSLSYNDVVKTALIECPGPEMSIQIMPSRGFIADSLAISAIKTYGNDGGFSNSFSKFIQSGLKNISLYCANPQKLEAALINTFGLYQDNELKGISVCVIGSPNSQELVTKAARIGITVTFAHNK